MITLAAGSAPLTADELVELVRWRLPGLDVFPGTLRRWLLIHDALPDQALVAAVPISTRGPDELFAPGNHVSAYFAHLPVHLESARERLEVTAASSYEGKAAHDALGRSTLERLASLLVPVLAVPPIAIYGRLHLANARPAPVNLVVSDVPGPTMPLYLAGHRAEAFYALGPSSTVSPSTSPPSRTWAWSVSAT